jgi:flagellar biosynthetic protein FliP
MPSHPTRNFVHHFLQMLVAMLVGMAVLGGLVSGIFAALGHSNLSHYAALRAMLMATYMSVGMSAWMRYRGHTWARVGEMAGAMFAPFLVLLVPFWSGLISGGALLICGHVLMLPCMLAAMLYRRDEYSQDHTSDGEPHGSMPHGTPIS